MSKINIKPIPFVLCTLAIFIVFVSKSLCLAFASYEVAKAITLYLSEGKKYATEFDVMIGTSMGFVLFFVLSFGVSILYKVFIHICKDEPRLLKHHIKDLQEQIDELV